MKEVVFTSEAYCKLIMHSAKYPHCSINGILLAENTKEDVKGKTLTYTDAIPLFHICLNVTPMAEIALCQIEQYAESLGLIMAGYYLANENLNDMSFDRPAHRIADKINEKFKASALVVVDNRLVTLDHSSPAIRVFHNLDSKWKPVDKFKVIVEEDILSLTSTLLREKVYYDLVDFDNHLDNISLDWKNLPLNLKIQKLKTDGKSEES